MNLYPNKDYSIRYLICWPITKFIMIVSIGARNLLLKVAAEKDDLTRELHARVVLWRGLFTRE